MSGIKIVSVNRWGNGLGIRLPKEFTDKAGITESSVVEIVSVNDGLMITAVKKRRKHIPLSKRLKNWDGHPYELNPEDIAWINMESAGDEE